MGGLSSSEVFDFADRRFGLDTMPLRAYIIALSLLIAGGLGGAAYIASITYAMTPNWLWIVGYFALAIPGIIVSAKSDNWLVSLFGYAFVVIPTGAITGPYVYLYEMESVIRVLLTTIGVTLAVGLAGAVYPKSVEHWGGFLLTGLLVIIFADLARIAMAILGFQPESLGWIDWVAVFVFTGFIFYDMNRAVRMSYTLNNAVDTAVALYLDIINLFIRLLAVMGHRRD
jgi:FtsH-binding integral membrane protein